MICADCGTQAAVLKTCRWRSRGEQRFDMCDSCHAPIAAVVWIVPGPGPCFGTCRGCGSWFSVRNLAERALGGKYNAPSGIAQAALNAARGDL